MLQRLSQMQRLSAWSVRSSNSFPMAKPMTCLENRVNMEPRIILWLAKEGDKEVKESAHLHYKFIIIIIWTTFVKTSQKPYMCSKDRYIRTIDGIYALKGYNWRKLANIVLSCWFPAKKGLLKNVTCSQPAPLLEFVYIISSPLQVLNDFQRLNWLIQTDMTNNYSMPTSQFVSQDLVLGWSPSNTGKVKPKESGRETLWSPSSSRISGVEPPHLENLPKDRVGNWKKCSRNHHVGSRWYFFWGGVCNKSIVHHFLQLE